MLGAPCVTQAIETCFDARDDNCNGLFDEGCGLPDGALQLMIAWDEPFADVDLEVFDPRGEPSLVGQRSTLGLTKDRDCPTESDECGGQNVEVVTLDGDTLPLGRYLVTVRLERAGQSAEPVSLRLGGHIGNEPIVGSYELSLAAPEIHLEFERRLAPGKDKSSGM
jgi:tRNA (guanosine-2'-O-)-methyltransferase